jgi:hypothetical protein
VSYESSELDKSSIYMEVLPAFAERRVTLIDDKRLITELRMLERKPRTGGKADMVDHAPNMHDDAANAACGALWQAGARKGGGWWDATDEQLANFRRAMESNLPSPYPLPRGGGGFSF